MPYFFACYNLRMSAVRLAKVAAVFLIVIVLTPSISIAATLPTSVVPPECNGVGGCQNVCLIAQTAQNILNLGIYLAVFIAAILFAWAGLKMLVSVANPGERAKAKEIFTNVAIGLVIILIGWLVIDVIMRAFAGASLLPWNAIC